MIEFIMVWEKIDPDFVVEKAGPEDTELIALSVEQEGNGQKGVIVNFGCHPTTLTGNNWLYSADYSGYMIESLKRARGKDFIPLFFNGCCGNVTQVDYNIGFIDTYQECQRIGYMLGVSTLEAMTNKHIVSNDEIRISKEMVPVKHISITDQQLKWAKSVMKKVEKEGMPSLQADGIPDAEYARRWIEMNDKSNIIDKLEVMVIRIGDVAFAGLLVNFFVS